ncbi:MAG: hypothetical protein R3C68_10520 [Myxococcota bacterium]
MGPGSESAWITLEPFYRVTIRRFSYGDHRSDNLAPHEARSISSVGIQLETYPAPRVAVLKDIGFYGGYSHALGTQAVNIGSSTNPQVSKQITSL